MTFPLVVELTPAPEPFEACVRLAGLPWLCFLDSTADPAHLGRCSFLMADPIGAVRSFGTRTERRQGSTPWEVVPGDALAVVEEALGPFASPPVPDLPPFQGGAAGWIGYEWGGVLERLPTPRFADLPIPDVALGLYDWVLAWDHLAGRCWLISTGLPAQVEARARRAADRAETVRRWLDGAALPAGFPPSRLPPVTRAPSWPLRGLEEAERAGIRSSFSHADYLSAVRRVRDYILAGDIFQANLSQRFEAPLREPPLELYARLRSLNPAPFGAYLDLDGARVLSVSPERFLHLDPATRQVETRPIKGTRPRGTGPMHDAALGQALVESEKDRAENVMIVDLLRNDLSRVCLPGTVRVPELFAIEHHPTVHHLVSTVVGRLAPGRSAGTLLRAAFPGGSITGAPKVRAMEIIAELEPTRRAVYCGAIGYLGLSGTLDTSIVIRTAVALEGTAYFQAGGGIVADSDPEQEYQETLDKAQALMAALAAA